VNPQSLERTATTTGSFPRDYGNNECEQETQYHRKNAEHFERCGRSLEEFLYAHAVSLNMSTLSYLFGMSSRTQQRSE
jgi:hypothetical protein